MSAPDVTSRLLIQQLRRRVDALAATLGMLSASVAGLSKFRILETSDEGAAGIWTAYDLLIVIADEDNLEPGFFRRNQTTTAAMDGVAGIQDAAGNKFERFTAT